jgi:pyruvate kinase
VRPAYCWLRADDTPAPDDTAVLPVSAGWLAGLSLGDAITLHDARGQSRLLVVRQVEDGAVRVSTDHTAYLTTGTMLRSGNGEHSRIGRLPALEQYLTLHVGDTLVLTRDCTPAPVQDAGPARIGCTLEAVFGHVLPGQLVHLDDAKISGTVLAAGDDEVTVRITRAAAGGSKLRAAKGINLPETVLPVSALTDTDRTNLEFVSAHGDLVELSFVRSPGDVEDLLAALAELDDQRLGIVLKIETAQAFEDLPAILLTAMRRAHTGVMIARGDLASECGYEELAELQEEILWLCEAAHLPVIWATQVLDQMARSGQPSRAEITDAAMGTRAECVMLNKGPHIVETVASLDDILVRMTSHHNKKNSLMRALRFWHATG